MSEFDCQVKSHGQLQLEFNARYPLEKKKKSSEYLLDMFIFTPSQLDINSNSYGVDKFLSDLQCYTRYTHPFMPLDKLLDVRCEISPLNRIKKLLANITLTSDVPTKAILYELRTLTNSYRGEVREVRLMLMREIFSGAHVDDIIESTFKFIGDIARVQIAVRELAKNFLDPRIPEILHEGLRNADEAISIKTEKVLLRLNAVFDNREQFMCLKNQILALIERQSNYRRNVGYQTVAHADLPKANELYLYREGMLKRWAQSAMYMNVNPSHTAKRITQIIAGFAAGLAMAFAVGAAFFASKNFDQNSMPWAIILVIAYIIKDRIKEVVRTILISRLPGWVSDMSVHLIDPADGGTVGKTSAWVRFCRPNDLDEMIIRYRDIDSKEFRKLLPPENVLHYHKRIRLNSQKLLDEHSRVNSITEILRLKLNHWLTEMDDPVEEIDVVRNGVLEKFIADRVYHVNIIIRLSEKNTNQHTYKRYRVVLTRNGIIRIEEVSLY